MIVPIYKPLGASTHQLAKKYGQQVSEKATHTGTLDPLAEGVVVVLTGADRFKKQTISAVKKTYEFEVLFGIATDSHDLLGVITEINTKQSVTINNIKQTLTAFTGKQKQQIPHFSAKRIKGKSFFDVARAGESLPKECESIEIFSLDLTGFTTMATAKLREQILQKIALVKGDFRQNEIQQGWQDFFATTLQREFLLAKVTATTSKRTYIRALVRDISQKLNTPATTFSILRTTNGPYTVQDCICLI